MSTNWICVEKSKQTKLSKLTHCMTHWNFKNHFCWFQVRINKEKKHILKEILWSQDAIRLCCLEIPSKLTKLILFANPMSPKQVNIAILFLRAKAQMNEMTGVHYKQSSADASQKIAWKWMDFLRRSEWVKKFHEYEIKRWNFCLADDAITIRGREEGFQCLKIPLNSEHFALISEKSVS